MSVEVWLTEELWVVLNDGVQVARYADQRTALAHARSIFLQLEEGDACQLCLNFTGAEQQSRLAA